MKTIITGMLLLGALSLTSCAHKAHHEGRAEAGKSCCKEKKDCKDGSCKLKKDKKSCCAGKKEDKKQ